LNIEIIAIGTELLEGKVSDTNTNFIAGNLTDLGFNVNYITMVRDNKSEMVKSIKNSLNRADIIITTGGLGPTADDITREAVAEATECPLYENREVREEIEEYFKNRKHEITENNYRQAKLPKGAVPLHNKQGTAPGILLDADNYIIISLPGVPPEMENLFFKEVIPYLKKLNPKKNTVIKFLNLFGIGESRLETEIDDIIKNSENPEITLLAEAGKVRIKLAASADSLQKAGNLIKNRENKIRKKVGQYIFGTDNQTLPEVVTDLLLKNNLNLGVAESCTGGLVGDRITNIPGSSQFFSGGIIAYSNKIKREKLNVPSKILNNKGAVSKQTAEAMARGIKKEFSTDIGLGITGIAGPGGGTPQKPVGLVYLSICDSYSQEIFQLNLNGDRQDNKWLTSQYAFYYLLNWLSK